MNAERIVVGCESCSHIYIGRIAEEEIILVTDDGACSKCGSTDFEVISEQEAELS